MVSLFIIFPLSFPTENVKMNHRISNVSVFGATDSSRSWLQTLRCVCWHSDLTCGDILDLLLFTPPQGHRVVQLIVFWRFTSICTHRLSQQCCCFSGHTCGLCFRILNALWPSFSFFVKKNKIKKSCMVLEAVELKKQRWFCGWFLDMDGQNKSEHQKDSTCWMCWRWSQTQMVWICPEEGQWIYQ